MRRDAARSDLSAREDLLWIVKVPKIVPVIASIVFALVALAFVFYNAVWTAFVVSKRSEYTGFEDWQFAAFSNASLFWIVSFFIGISGLPLLIFKKTRRICPFLMLSSTIATGIAWGFYISTVSESILETVWALILTTPLLVSTILLFYTNEL